MDGFCLKVEGLGAHNKLVTLKILEDVVQHHGIKAYGVDKESYMFSGIAFASVKFLKIWKRLYCRVRFGCYGNFIRRPEAQEASGEETLSFPCRTRASTSSLVTKSLVPQPY